MKKTVCAALAAILTLSLLPACTGGAPRRGFLSRPHRAVDQPRPVKGNYVMLVCGEDDGQIVEDFNALFE